MLRPLVIVYGVLSVVGLVGTWYFNLAFGASSDSGGAYLAGWFANDASSSAAVDIIVAGLAACVLYVVESRRLGWPLWRPILLIVLSFVLAVAFTFPLFLALREHTRARATRRSGPRQDATRRPEPDAH